ncbi:hypothetical protein [Streptococcus suis]|uniref:hypothetical protein n=1 Tax=Streptococcus suis TaxID=1307 RepID=UPI000CF6D9E0|nr:hypothetical protein [Streptococcus suis]
MDKNINKLLELSLENISWFQNSLRLRLINNVAGLNSSDVVDQFLNDVLERLKRKKFNVEMDELTNLTTYQKLIDFAPGLSKNYIIKEVCYYYTEIILPTKIEIYG